MMTVARLVVGLVLAASLGAAQEAGDCPADLVSFEVITGFVYTAPQDMLDSQPGTLILNDCIETCRANSSCKAINFETGLCVLFSSSADENKSKCPKNGLKTLTSTPRSDAVEIVCSPYSSQAQLMQPPYLKYDLLGYLGYLLSRSCVMLRCSGQLTKSQYPVFTIYVQKNCLPSAPSCDAAWSFERVMDHQLDTEVGN